MSAWSVKGNPNAGSGVYGAHTVPEPLVMLYPLPPKDFLTADNFVIAGACIGTILLARLIYLRLTRPALMSGTLSQR